MVSRKDVTIVDKDKVPAARLPGAYTFLRDMGKVLEKDKAIQVKAKDAAEAKKIQNRWRAYFKGTSHTRHETQPDDSVLVFLWKES